MDNSSDNNIYNFGYCCINNELDIIFKPNINIDKHNKMKKRCGILKNKIYSVKNNRTLLIEHFLLLRFVIKYLREVQMYFKKN